MVLDAQEISVADISTVSLIRPLYLFEFPYLIYKSTHQSSNPKYWPIIFSDSQEKFNELYIYLCIYIYGSVPSS